MCHITTDASACEEAAEEGVGAEEAVAAVEEAEARNANRGDDCGG